MLLPLQRTLQFSGAWLNWFTEKVTTEGKNNAGVLVKTLLHTPIICKKWPFPKYSCEAVWVIRPRFFSSSWFHGSACLQYMVPSILVQSVLYLCHPWLRDNDISHLLNFWTESYVNSHTTSKDASEGIRHGSDLKLQKKEKKHLHSIFNKQMAHGLFYTAVNFEVPTEK